MERIKKGTSKTGKTIYALTDEDVRMLKEVSELPDLNDGFEKDFIGKAVKYWPRGGATEPQLKTLIKLYNERIGGVTSSTEPADNGQPVPQEVSDDGLKAEHVSAVPSPDGFIIQTPIGAIGKSVTRREAQLLVSWLNHAWLEIEKIYGPPPLPEADRPPTDENEAPFGRDAEGKPLPF